MKDHEKLSKRYLLVLVLIHIVHGVITNIRWYTSFLKTGIVPTYSLFSPDLLIVLFGICFLMLPLSLLAHHHAKAAGKKGIRIFSAILSIFYLYFIVLYLIMAFISSYVM